MKNQNIDQYNESVTYLRRYRKLPADFKDFYLASSIGWTIAHEAVVFQALPEWFKDYHLADKDGWTVGHMAAAYGHLPADYNAWHLEDQYGGSVLATFLSCGMKNRSDRFLLFGLPVWKDKEITVADFIFKESDKIYSGAREVLKAEVLAWQATQEIKSQLELEASQIKSRPAGVGAIFHKA